MNTKYFTRFFAKNTQVSQFQVESICCWCQNWRTLIMNNPPVFVKECWRRFWRVPVCRLKQELISAAAVSKCWMCADKEKLQSNNNTSISFFCSNIFYRFNIANIYDEFSLGLSDFHNILWIELQIISVKKERDLNK